MSSSAGRYGQGGSSGSSSGAGRPLSGAVDPRAAKRARPDAAASSSTSASGSAGPSSRSAVPPPRPINPNTPPMLRVGRTTPQPVFDRNKAREYQKALCQSSAADLGSANNLHSVQEAGGLTSSDVKLIPVCWYSKRPPQSRTRVSAGPRGRDVGKDEQPQSLQARRPPGRRVHHAPTAAGSRPALVHWHSQRVPCRPGG
jgi:hypothetical protein